MKKETALEKISHPTTGDVNHALVKIGLSILSAPAAELFSLIIASPMSKRRDAFLTDMYEELKKLKDKIPEFDFDSLKDNDLFQTIIINAAKAAISTHQQEKIEALKNAVLNTVTNININETTQLIFLNDIEKMTPLHIRILLFLQNPTEYYFNVAKLPEMVTTRISFVFSTEITGVDLSVITQIINDLESFGFLEKNQGITINDLLTINPNTPISYSTFLGNDFLKYITEP